MPDLKYFIGNTIPTYADYRLEVDSLYPDLAPRIAIRDMMPDNNPLLMEDDLAFQIAPDILAEVPADVQEVLRNEFCRMWDGYKSGGVCMSFFNLKDKSAFDVRFCYLALGDYTKDPRDTYSDISIYEEYKMGPLLKYNEAALDVPLLAWFCFYHELEHAISALNQTKIISDYETLLRETRGDGFAALHLLNRFGARAWPVIETLADMRLSKFYQYGPDHFSTPALRAIVKDHKAGQLILGDGLRRSFNAVADNYARKNFLHKDDVEAYMAAEKSCDPILDRQFVFQRRESVLKAYCENENDINKPWRAQQNALFNESEAIMERVYMGLDKPRF